MKMWWKWDGNRMGVENSVEGLWKLEVVWKLCGNNTEIVWNGREIYQNQSLEK